MAVRKKSTLLAQGKPRTLGDATRPWRVRLYGPEPRGTRYQVMFRAPVEEGESWKRVLRRENSEREARTIFAQAEAALDAERETPARADVRASRTIEALGEAYLDDSRQRGKQPRTIEQRESLLNAHIVPSIGEVAVAKWRVEHSRRVMDKGGMTIFSLRGREDLRGQLAAMRKLAWRRSVWSRKRRPGAGSLAAVRGEDPRRRLRWPAPWRAEWTPSDRSVPRSRLRPRQWVLGDATTSSRFQGAGEKQRSARGASAPLTDAQRAPTAREEAAQPSRDRIAAASDQRARRGATASRGTGGTPTKSEPCLVELPGATRAGTLAICRYGDRLTGEARTAQRKMASHPSVGGGQRPKATVGHARSCTATFAIMRRQGWFHDELEEPWEVVAYYLGDKLTTVLNHYVRAGEDALRSTVEKLESF